MDTNHKNTFKAVYFDMDGTLIRNTNSVRYLCSINNKKEEVLRLEDLVESDKMSWIEADFIKSGLMEGLSVNKIEENFDSEIVLISGIKECLKYVKSLNMKTLLVTAGPIDVAKALARRYSFDFVFGSEYEIKNGIYTGNLLKHMDDYGKLNCLIEFCKVHNFSLNECIAVGDSASDIEVFNRCGRRIAINYSDALKGRADEYVISEDLSDIVGFIGECIDKCK